MEFKAKLNAKFFVVFALLLGIVIFGWYGVYFLNANEIMMEDAPMDPSTKLIFTVFLSAVVLSWSVSALVLLRQIVFGRAFTLDDEGVHDTATAVNLLAFIFVVPIRKIPYDAIEKIDEENGALTLHIDKERVEVFSLFRPFLRKSCHLFSGFTAENRETIKAELDRRMQRPQ